MAGQGESVVTCNAVLYWLEKASAFIHLTMLCLCYLWYLEIFKILLGSYNALPFCLRIKAEPKSCSFS